MLHSYLPQQPGKEQVQCANLAMVVRFSNLLEESQEGGMLMRSALICVAV